MFHFRPKLELWTPYLFQIYFKTCKKIPRHFKIYYVCKSVNLKSWRCRNMRVPRFSRLRILRFGKLRILELWNFEMLRCWKSWILKRSKRWGHTNIKILLTWSFFNHVATEPHSHIATLPHSTRHTAYSIRNTAYRAQRTAHRAPRTAHLTPCTAHCTQVLDKDWGPEGGWFALRNDCFKHRYQHQEYKFYPFNKVTIGTLVLGKFLKFSADGTVATFTHRIFKLHT